jgi:RNA polymerase sigma-70 factor (ECF subfamily)
LGVKTPEAGSEELVRRLCAGDREALDVLLRRHLPALRGYVRLHSDRVLRAREASTDLVQSVCREILEHLDRFEHPSENAFKHWLYATALRKVQNKSEYYRAQKRDAALELRIGERGDGELSACYATLSSPSGALMAREELEQLESAFDRLPEEYREVLVLARIVGLSRAEIGERMGRSEGAVRALLFRAQARLAALMAPHA